jgi:hypothetical protein
MNTVLHWAEAQSGGTAMNVTIIGAGNIGTYFAVEFSAKGHHVIVHSSRPSLVNNLIVMMDVDANEKKIGKIASVTSDMAQAVQDAELLIVTHAAFMLEETANRMYDYIKSNVTILLIPGTGGGEFAFRKHVENKNINLCGLQRVPAIARLKEYGKLVCVTGKRERLHMGGIPYHGVADCAKLVSDVFEIPCDLLPNYLSVTLTPSNPILHTSRLCSLFHDYVPGVVYPRNPLFYQDWNNDSSQRLLACDEELQKICAMLSEFDLSSVRSLRLHYESNTPEAMTQKIRSIKSLQGILTPMISVDGGYIPDFSSRYFTADFPYGLSIVRQIAGLLGLDVPVISDTLNWYYSLAGNHVAGFDLEKFGIKKLDDFIAFYLRSGSYRKE